MKVKLLLPFLLGVAYGVVATLLGGNANQEDEAKQISVLVASGVIEPHVRLDDKQFDFRPMPVSQVPPGTIRSIEEYKHRPLITRALPGQVITRSMLGERASGPTSKMSLGYRIFSTPLVNPSAQLDLSSPYDVVDVFITYPSRDAEGNETLKTKRIVEKAKVFAMQLRDSEDAKGIVALLVIPKDWDILMAARNKGLFTFRSPTNDDERLGPKVE